MYTKNLSLDIFDTGISEAQENMAWDIRCLEQLKPDGKPVLHTYDWAGLSATYGHFIDLRKHVDLEKARERGLTFARRPTGGGIIFHIWDLAFSFFMPAGHPACSLNTLDNYKFVNEIVLDVIKEYLSLQGEAVLIPAQAPERGADCNHFCMARPTIYDVVYRGLKVAGAAQRRTKNGYLHQGTISLAAPDLNLLREVLLSGEVVQAMEYYTFAPVGEGLIGNARASVKEILLQKFAAKLYNLHT